MVNLINKISKELSYKSISELELSFENSIVTNKGRITFVNCATFGAYDESDEDSEINEYNLEELSYDELVELVEAVEIQIEDNDIDEYKTWKRCQD